MALAVLTVASSPDDFFSLWLNTSFETVAHNDWNSFMTQEAAKPPSAPASALTGIDLGLLMRG